MGICRKSFVLRIKEGKQAEYRTRHHEIWPEMQAMLKAAGISNYSIWLEGNFVFGYYETEQLEFTEAYKKGSPVQARWSASMTELTECRTDGTMDIRSLECVFLLE